MAEEVNFRKKVFNKQQYEKTINTDFNQLGVKSSRELIDSQPTVENFFELYNSLFYDIPERGSNNSHEFIINQSSEYINFEKENEEITALQNEISDLRKQLLEEKQKNLELQNDSLNNG